jgi:DNA-binding response OmpR family regulator
VTFSVADTGIGIAPEDQERIFQEFSQVDTPLQRKVKGTGLGLPLSRRLAELLGGRLEVTSSPGQGSTFSAVLPITYATAIVGAIAPESGFAADPGRLPVLIVENDPNTLLVYDRYLRESAFQALPAHSLREARQWLSTTTPVCIVLDIMFGGEDAWKFLAELKTQDQTSGIPVIVVSTVDDPRKGLALGASDYAVKPVDRTWLLRRIAELTSPEAAPRVLVIDDDDGARYVLGHHLKAESCAVIEAGDGAEGLRIAIEQQPALIVLDLIMPGLSGFDVLKLLRSTPRTKAIPIIVSTSKALAAVERLEIEGFNASVFPKDALARDGGGAALRRALTEAGLHVA